MELTKLQVKVEQDLFAKFKSACAYKQYSMTDVIIGFMGDFVNEGQEEWLDKLFAKRLNDAHKHENSKS